MQVNETDITNSLQFNEFHCSYLTVTPVSSITAQLPKTNIFVNAHNDEVCGGATPCHHTSIVRSGNEESKLLLRVEWHDS